MRIPALLIAILIGSLGHWSEAKAADNYPSRVTTIVVPFAAGSPTDIVGRRAANALTQALGQQVIVDDKPGASGIIGSQAVARSAPDGYTLLLVTNSTHAANVTLFKSLPYDPVKDFTPISSLASQPLMLMVNPGVPARTVAELVAYGKANPGKLNGGYSGASTQIAAAMFADLAGFKMVGVPYKGIPPAVMDLLTGQISFTFADFGNLSHVKAGKAVALAVTSLKRTPLAPNLPTLAESGVKDFEVVGWQGIAAPAGTDPAIIKRLFEGLKKHYDTPEVRQHYESIGFQVDTSSSPAEYAEFIKRETVRWGNMVRAARIEPQ